MHDFAEKLLELAATPWGPLVLMLHGYLESFILPVAHDLFLVTVALADPKYSFAFAAMSTLCSTLGLVTGYVIGQHGGQFLLSKVIGKRSVVYAKKKIHEYDVWAIALACLTPVPVKVFAVLAGVVKLDLRKFIVVGLLSRGLRFFIVGALIFFWGEALREWILEYMASVMMLIFLIMVVLAVAWKIAKKMIKRWRDPALTA